MNRRNFLKTLSILLGAMVVHPIGEIIPSQGIKYGRTLRFVRHKRLAFAGQWQSFIIDSRYFMQNGSEVLFAEGEDRSVYVGYFHPGDYNDIR